MQERLTHRLAVALALLALALQLPLADLDLFSQLRFGAIQIQSGALYRQDQLVLPLLGLPIINPGWLSQVLGAALVDVGGLRLLHLLHAVALVFVFELLLSGRKPPLGVRMLSYLLAFMVAQSNLSPRPQIFALIGFAGLYALERSRLALPAKCALLIPLLLLWQNCHASLSLALIPCLGFFVENPKQWRFPVALCVAALICSLATPDGWALQANNAYNVHVSRDILGISEWLPAWHSSVRTALAVFWLSLPLTALFVWKNPRCVELRAWLTPAIFLLLSFWAARFTVFFALAMLPLWARLIEAYSLTLTNFRLGQSLRHWKLVSVTVCVLLIWRAPTVASSIPWREISELRRTSASGTIYNYREWAGPLVYWGAPDWRVTIDGRLYLYSPEQWSRYYAEADGLVPAEEIMARYHPALLVLHQGFQAGLIRQLRRDQHFVLLREDPEMIVLKPAA